jgi:hypothetical protein
VRQDGRNRRRWKVSVEAIVPFNLPTQSGPVQAIWQLRAFSSYLNDWSKWRMIGSPNVLRPQSQTAHAHQ